MMDTEITSVLYANCTKVPLFFVVVCVYGRSVSSDCQSCLRVILPVCCLVLCKVTSVCHTIMYVCMYVMMTTVACLDFD